MILSVSTLTINPNSSTLRFSLSLMNIMILLFLHVSQDGPKRTSVYSRPSGEIKEGRSVTLSCSSDANPAAEYTWFKNNQPLLWGPSQRHTFPSVSPEDRGTYRCQAENKYGQLRSNLLFMDVKCELNICPICKNPIYI